MDRVAAIRHAVLQAERRAGDGSELGGTGQTIIKRRMSPVGMLIERGDIGAEEVRAADEISLAFLALSGGLLMRSAAWERVDCCRREKTHTRGSEAVQRYQEWARVWSKRKESNSDPMLEVVIATVIDERPLWTVDEDIGRRHGLSRKALVAGLRDYAARSGWVSWATAQHWMDQAARVFDRRY